MTTARDIMTRDPRIVDESTTVSEVARTLKSDDIGAVVVCNAERRLQGVITDRDIAVEVVAAGKDPASTPVSELLSGRETVTIGADDDVEEAVRTMTDHAVRRLPVIDGQDVVGVISQADVATHCDDDVVARLVRAVSSAGDNTGQG